MPLNLPEFKIDNDWTLFLDRDGVINKKLEADYVKTLEEFEFLPGVLVALKRCSQLFAKIVIVTNQQGIGKGIMTHDDLAIVHAYLLSKVEEAGGRIDKIYYCPALAAENHPCRKPNVGMALNAKKDFPEIDFEKSILVGDSNSDIEMGRNAGMKTVFITDENENPLANVNYQSLFDFIKDLG